MSAPTAEARQSRALRAVLIALAIVVVFGVSAVGALLWGGLKLVGLL